mmetsp:Transcript_19069/g.45960  ORF Transcript_19069/g.45960 Transcript_19069/m.45960 type:complete len:225 (+) Transcript_19069:32-706(+)
MGSCKSAPLSDKPAARPTAEYDDKLKILLIGDSAVGKSSLLLRYTQDKFDAGHVMTIGVDFEARDYRHPSGKTIRVQVWDTGGQEKYKSCTMSHQLWRGVNGVILTYDVTDQASFEHVKDWSKLMEDKIGEMGNQVKKVLVGNKVDLEGQRAVDKAKGEALAQQYSIDFFETSAKEHVNVNEVFHRLADLLVSDRSRSSGPQACGSAGLQPTPKATKAFFLLAV